MAQDNLLDRSEDPCWHRFPADNWQIGIIQENADAVLTLAGAAASRYIDGNWGGGEDFHVQAEFAYTRLAAHILSFWPEINQVPKNADVNVKRAYTTLTSFGLLHRCAPSLKGALSVRASG